MNTSLINPISFSKLLMTVMVFFSLTGYGESYNIDKSHSTVGFSVKHLLVSDVDGVFTEYTPVFEMTQTDIRKFDLEIEVKSIDTRNTRRDDDLRSDKFFNVAKFSKITFRSTGYKASSAREGKLTGELVMKNVTQKVVLDVNISEPIQFRGKEVYGVNIAGKVNRKDFKIGESFPSAVVSDEVILKTTLEISQ